MSGGSFDYLCYQDGDDLFKLSTIESMQQMEKRLVELGYTDAASATKQLQTQIMEIRGEANSLMKSHDALREFAFDSIEEHFADSTLYTLLSMEEEFQEKKREADAHTMKHVHGTLKSYVTNVQAQKDKLEDLWKAVEWYDSADYGFDSVDEAIKEYRK